MFEILDGLVATVAVVLILSLIVQGIQQIIKQAWSFKSKYMEQELLAMFIVAKAVDTRATFSENPVSRSLKALWRFLLPARSQFKRLIADPKNEVFVGILDLVRSRLVSIGYDDLSLLETMSSVEFVALLEDIHAGLSDDVRWTFDATFKQVIDDARKWFDLTVKAFQDHYERRMKIWSYVLSGVVVVWLNADLFTIYQEFSANRVLRDSVVKMAGELTSTPRDSLLIPAGDANANSPASRTDTLAANILETQISKIEALVKTKSFHVFRWNIADGDSIHLADRAGIHPARAMGDFLDVAKANAPGWILMTVLVGLGAPFWYDLLKTMMGLKDKAQLKAQ